MLVRLRPEAPTRMDKKTFTLFAGKQKNAKKNRMHLKKQWNMLYKGLVNEGVF